jgi:hypothetical protein
MAINLIHKPMTDEELLEQLKKAYSKHPGIFMSPEEWLRRRGDRG